MITANELRIGNLFRNWSGKIEEVIAIENSTLFAINGFTPKDVHPIPLSPKVLAACGAAQGVNPTWYTITPDFYLSYHEKGSSIYVRVEADSCHPIKKNIRDLHQLMNLYYALTGKELPVKIEEL